MPLPQTAGNYEIASAADWNTAVAESLTPCILTQGFDVAGGNLRETSIEIDLNGKSVLNIGGVVNQFNQQRNNFFNGGNCYNGELNFSYNRAHTGNFSIFSDTLHENMTVSGDIVNTDSGRILRVIGTVPSVDTGVQNNHYSVNLTSDTVQLLSNNTGSSYIDKCIFTGVYTAGTTFQIFGNQYGFVTNSFYRTTDNPTPSANNNGTTPTGMPKTTAELQDIDTYTNLATAGLDEVYSMAESASYSNEQWVLATSSYPELVFTEATEWKPYTINGSPVSGVIVEYRTHDSLGGQGTLLETVVSNAQGIAALTAEVPAGKFLSATAFYDDGSDPNSSFSINPRFIAGYPQ